MKVGKLDIPIFFFFFPTPLYGYENGKMVVFLGLPIVRYNHKKNHFSTLCFRTDEFMSTGFSTFLQRPHIMARKKKKIPR